MRRMCEDRQLSHGEVTGGAAVVHAPPGGRRRLPDLALLDPSWRARAAHSPAGGDGSRGRRGHSAHPVEHAGVDSCHRHLQLPVLPPLLAGQGRLNGRYALRANGSAASSSG
eukprot:jgi/Mesen1/3327/ME000191S02460